MGPQVSTTMKEERKNWISLLSYARTDHLEAVRKKLNDHIGYT